MWTIRFSRRQRGPKLAAFAALARVVADAASTYVKIDDDSGITLGLGS